MGAEVVIVDTGTANLASVRAGLTRIGASPVITQDRDKIENAAILMLPGVGALAPAMQVLAEHRLVQPLQQRIADGRPTLAVCLGLQLLCKDSEESPGIPGLGVVAESVTRFSDRVRVPQLGWNRIEPQAGCELLQPGYAYFANSFKLDRAPDGWHAALCDHGGKFVAAFERGCVLACQFHPELSGDWGADLLKRWFERARGKAGAAC